MEKRVIVVIPEGLNAYQQLVKEILLVETGNADTRSYIFCTPLGGAAGVAALNTFLFLILDIQLKKPFEHTLLLCGYETSSGSQTALLENGQKLAREYPDVSIGLIWVQEVTQNGMTFEHRTLGFQAIDRGWTQVSVSLPPKEMVHE